MKVNKKNKKLIKSLLNNIATRIQDEVLSMKDNIIVSLENLNNKLEDINKAKAKSKNG